MTGDGPETESDVPSIDHVAVAVPDLEQAAAFYRNAFGAIVDDPVEVSEHAIRIAIVHFANVSLELMQPLTSDSPVGRFLARHPKGGLHHISLTTREAAAAFAAATDRGLNPLTEPRTGYHGRQLFFLDPKSTFGTMIEIEEKAAHSETAYCSRRRQHERE